MGLLPAKRPAEPVPQEVAIIFTQLPNTQQWEFNSIVYKADEQHSPTEQANMEARRLSENGYHTHVISTILGRDNPNGH